MFIISVFATQQNLIYDANGNLITGDGKYREYNVFNQLVSVRNGNSSSGYVIEDYIYDPAEEKVLIKRDKSNSTNAVIKVTLYVNDNFVREYGNPSAAILINDTYYAKDDSGTVGEIRYIGNFSISKFPKNRKLYYHNDLKTSVSVLTNDSGSIVEQIFYEPYGKILAGGVKEKYTYENKEYDPHIKTYDFHFRQYQPDWNKFTQPDTVFQNIYDPQLLNRYTFERNNPYKYKDENGQTFRGFAFGGLKVIAGASAVVLGGSLIVGGAPLWIGIGLALMLVGSFEGISGLAQTTGGLINNAEKDREMSNTLEQTSSPYDLAVSVLNNEEKNLNYKKNKPGDILNVGLNYYGAYLHEGLSGLKSEVRTSIITTFTYIIVDFITSSSKTSLSTYTTHYSISINKNNDKSRNSQVCANGICFSTSEKYAEKAKATLNEMEKDTNG